MFDWQSEFDSKFTIFIFTFFTQNKNKACKQLSGPLFTICRNIHYLLCCIILRPPGDCIPTSPTMHRGRGGLNSRGLVFPVKKPRCQRPWKWSWARTHPPSCGTVRWRTSTPGPAWSPTGGATPRPGAWPCWTAAGSWGPSWARTSSTCGRYRGR